MSNESNKQSVIRLGPISRVSLGLTALMISLLLIANVVLDFAPDNGQVERRTRQRVAANLGAQMTSLLEAGDQSMAGKVIQKVLAGDPDIRSILVRRSDGYTMLHRGDTSAERTDRVGSGSTADLLRVPVLAGGNLWGEIEVKFATAPVSVKSWLAQPTLQILAVLGLGGFLLCYVYLRRVMQFLDPSAAVPDRVRKAFDTLTEGVVIIDQQARIVLANDSFRRLHPEAGAEITGHKIDALRWLLADRQGDANVPMPWSTTLRTSVTVKGDPLNLPQPDGPTTRLLVTSAPIADNKGRPRGCMVTFDDVSAVHRANDDLHTALEELKRSREHIEEQNRELRLLATRDSLTSCLNRRAFFELAETALEASRRTGTATCCIMVDIDHFKQFNDLYGHAVGDQVIRSVARALAARLRRQDILGRYGGEEFCIVMPGSSEEQAVAFAESCRIDIEKLARQIIRGTAAMKTTASFGVSGQYLGGRTLEHLIDQADQALYRAKAAGRNRVTAFEAVVV